MIREPKSDGRSLRFRDRTGERHGRLVVVRLVAKRAQGESRWLCNCDCGASKEVAARQLHRRHTTSCGCRGREALSGSPRANKLPAGEASFRALFGQYKRSASQRNIPFELEHDAFRTLVTSDCHYCGGPPSREYLGGPKINGSFLCNGVDRLWNDQGYTVKNARSCCTECNMAKGRMSPVRWSAWLHRVAIYRWSKQALHPLAPIEDAA